MFFSLLQMAWVLIRNKVQVCCHVPAFPYLLLSLFSTEVVISHAMFESWIMLTHLWLQSEFGSAPSFSSSGYPEWNFCSYEYQNLQILDWYYLHHDRQYLVHYKKIFRSVLPLGEEIVWALRMSHFLLNDKVAREWWFLCYSEESWVNNP